MNRVAMYIPVVWATSWLLFCSPTPSGSVACLERLRRRGLSLLFVHLSRTHRRHQHFHLAPAPYGGPLGCMSRLGFRERLPARCLRGCTERLDILCCCRCLYSEDAQHQHLAGRQEGPWQRCQQAEGRQYAAAVPMSATARAWRWWALHRRTRRASHMHPAALKIGPGPVPATSRELAVELAADG